MCIQKPILITMALLDSSLTVMCNTSSDYDDTMKIITGLTYTTTAASDEYFYL